MKFQAAHDLNVPFFVSGGFRLTFAPYNSTYLNTLADPYKGYDWQGFEFATKSNMEVDVLLGGQIKINKSFFIPIFLQFGDKRAIALIEEYDAGEENIFFGSIYQELWLLRDRKGPAEVTVANQGLFAGSGLFINTNMIKGGIYLGCELATFHGDSLSMRYKDGDKIGTYFTNLDSNPAAFKIALVPLIPTSEWALVGKVLESIFGYFGLNDVLYAPDVDEEDSKFAAYAQTINAALDISFNRIKWGSFDLDLNALYTRGKFDVAAKADTFGLKMAGSFSNFPFGFTLEGGWKHFYSVHKFFAQEYPDGAYFNGSVYFPLKKATLGFIYQYNNIYGSTYTVAMSINNFLDYFFGLNPDTRYTDSGQFDNSSVLSFRGGLRYRHNGWKATSIEGENK